MQIISDNNFVSNATVGFSRPDVATAYKDARYANSGWRFSYNIGTRDNLKKQQLCYRSFAS